MSEQIEGGIPSDDLSFGDVLEESLNEIYVFDAETLCFLRVNRHARENLGYSCPELRQLTPLDIKPALLRESFGELLRQLRTGEKRRIVFESYHQRKDGSRYDVEVHLQTTQFQDAPCFAAIILDVTERKLTEKALRESQELVRAVVKTAADSIITVGQDGIVIGINPATERMFGYSEQELVGKNISVLMPEPYRSEHDSHIARYLRTGEPHIIGIGREVVGRRKDGSIFPIDLAVSEVDQLGFFAGIIRDISERKELQRQVLEIAAEEQRRIGHELHDGTQQELTGLSLIAQNLVDSLDGKGNDFLEEHGLLSLRKVANRLSQGLSETNRNVQMLSRGLVPVEVDARGLMNALDELAASICVAHSTICKFRCTQAVDFTDNFKATHVFRIAQEAVTNALKHGQPDRIEIRLSEQSNFIALTIQDNGTGIAERRANSSGRGLKIMGYRAGLIGATLQVGQAAGGGTLVTCTIPAV
jgi:two-component system sensor kinase FixL